jgi:dihydrofolate reductase
LKAIAVADRNWGLGKEGKLLVHLPGDWKYFREQTLGKVIVMGRETLEGLPGGEPLPGRTTVALSRNPSFKANCSVVSSLEECLDYLSRFNGDEVYIAGGADIYRQFLPYCDECLITRIDAEFPADRFFDNLDERGDFTVAGESGPYNENGVSYRFVTYKRVD